MNRRTPERDRIVPVMLGGAVFSLLYLIGLLVVALTREINEPFVIPSGIAVVVLAAGIAATMRHRKRTRTLSRQ